MVTHSPRLHTGGSAPALAVPRVCPLCGHEAEGTGELFCPRDGAYLVEPADLAAAGGDPMLGRRVNEFAIVARIGTGGMGTVYRAIQTGVDRQVALKLLRADLSDDPVVVQRFLQEAKATARLQHRNLAITFTSGSTSDGLFYIAMEYIDGRALSTLIERSWQVTERGPTFTLEPARAIRLWCQIVAALAHAHRLGIVHRDLKPENVLLVDSGGDEDDEGEQSKVVDFGIAKILDRGKDGGLVKTDVGQNVGTGLYMAPEQLMGAPAHPRLDVYALGLLLYEMLSGLLPFATRYEDRENPTALLHKRLTSAAPAPSCSVPLSPQLLLLIADLLDREPLRRPAHAGEVRDRLREIPEMHLERMRRSSLPPAPPADITVSDGNAVPALSLDEPRANKSSNRPRPPAAPARAATPAPVAIRQPARTPTTRPERSSKPPSKPSSKPSSKPPVARSRDRVTPTGSAGPAGPAGPAGKDQSGERSPVGADARSGNQALVPVSARSPSGLSNGSPNGSADRSSDRALERSAERSKTVKISKVPISTLLYLASGILVLLLALLALLW